MRELQYKSSTHCYKTDNSLENYSTIQVQLYQIWKSWLDTLVKHTLVYNSGQLVHFIKAFMYRTYKTTTSVESEAANHGGKIMVEVKREKRNVQWGEAGWVGGFYIHFCFTEASFELQPSVGALWERFWRRQGIHMPLWLLVGHSTFWWHMSGRN